MHNEVQGPHATYVWVNPTPTDNHDVVLVLTKHANVRVIFKKFVESYLWRLVMISFMVAKISEITSYL